MKTIDDVIAHLRSRTDAGPRDEWPFEGCEDHFLTVRPRERPSAALFMTKSPCLEWFDVGRDVAVFSMYPLIYDVHASALIELLRLPTLVFVGDLDPIDLTVFAFLRDRLGKRGIEVVHAGVGERWLTLAERTKPLGWAEIKLEGLEKLNWELLRTACPDVPAIIGPRCTGLLDAGLKIEIEGAANPAAYGRAHLVAIAEMMLAEHGVAMTPWPISHPSE